MTESKKNSISILLLSYNHEEFIEESIKSVFIQKEKIKDIELIVIDDGSTDNTPEIIKKLQKNSPIKMTVIFNKHEGIKSISKNLLRMIEIASNKYIAFLAGDDIYLPSRFTEQIKTLNKNKKCKIVYGNGINYKNKLKLNSVMPKIDSNILKSKDPCLLYKYVTERIPIIFIQTILAESDFLKKIKPFDCNLIADDWVFNIKVFDYLCKNNLDFDFIDKPLFKRNILDKRTSGNPYHHFNRIAEVAISYIDKENKDFYLNFYNVFFKKFLNEKDYISAANIYIRKIFLKTGFKCHNKNITKTLPLERKIK